MFHQNPAAIRILLLLTGDAVLSAASFCTGFYARFGELQEGAMKYQPFGLKMAAFAIILLFTMFFLELYNGDMNLGRKETILRTIAAVGLTFFVLSALYYLAPAFEVGRGILLFALAVFLILGSLWHLIYNFCVSIPAFAKRVLIFGTGATAGKIGDLILSTNHNHVLTGYINYSSENSLISPVHIIGKGESLLETARREHASKIIISMTERRGSLPVRDMLNCKLSGIDVLDAPSFYEQMTGKLLIEDIKPSWFIFSEGFKITPLKKFVKKIFDLTLAAAGSLIALPFVILIAALIKIDSRGPVFFTQVRVGEREKKFVLFKFRTMRYDAERDTGAIWASENDERITWAGKFLRKTRLDEIPQLFNVLKGDMSFVGPRPERPEFIEELKEIIPYYSERHFIKPGITGWAQIKYPYGASVKDALEKLRYDLYYIKHLSLFLDLLIVLETVKVVFFGRGGR
jgi:sugar transferase (PEP-CTERM system associated)